MVVENQDPIQRAIEDRFVFTLGSVEDLHGLSMFAASPKKETGVEENGDAESDQDEREQQGGQGPAIEASPERSREQGDRCEGNENGTSPHPVLRPGSREDRVPRVHVATASGGIPPIGRGSHGPS